MTSFVALAVFEFIATRAFAPLPDVWSLWPVVGIVHALPKILLLSTVIFAVVGWRKRAMIVGAFDREANDFQVAAMAAVTATATLIALLSRAQLATAGSSEWNGFAYVYAAALLLAGAALMLVAAPPTFWSAIAKTCKLELALALGFGAFGFIAGSILDRERGSFLSEDSWAALSGATLHLSYWMLSVFDHTAVMEPATRTLGAGDFSVRIFAACSGYEGMMLISAFLLGYIAIFRRSLRFPNVMLLFPLAMGAIWILNSFRIALLVFIGAHVSPDIALGGFHSQFGWISFLLIAITIMTSAQRIAFFGVDGTLGSRSSGVSVKRRSTELNPALVFLAPFCALMAGQIITRIAAPHDYLLYPVKVAAVAAVLYVLRDAYRRMSSAPDLTAILLGAIAGAIWIATDPDAQAHTALEASLKELAPAALLLWLAFRAIGTIVMVPIAEELAFRGYLYRVMLSARFEAVDFRAFGFLALAVSSVLFGLMHDRWIAGSLAGLLYALVMIRRGRIADAVAAHMTTNAVIFMWAVSVGQWSLL
ncbi:MAG: exosortase E/protease, VPEID-CTERM system [Proteobacteria bacterium]|nr:exosortase E/protease, VPEID-CTERM system [Pseudomonadota bacterium]